MNFTIQIKSWRLIISLPQVFCVFFFILESLLILQLIYTSSVFFRITEYSLTVFKHFVGIVRYVVLVLGNVGGPSDDFAQNLLHRLVNILLEGLSVTIGLYRLVPPFRSMSKVSLVEYVFRSR